MRGITYKRKTKVYSPMAGRSKWDGLTPEQHAETARPLRAYRYRLGIETLIAKLTERKEWLDDDQCARIRALVDSR